jgi:hypothetical protein
MFVIYVKADVKSRRVLQGLALRQGAQSKREAVLVKKDSESVFSSEYAAHFEVRFKKEAHGRNVRHG